MATDSSTPRSRLYVARGSPGSLSPSSGPVGHSLALPSPLGTPPPPLEFPRSASPSPPNGMLLPLPIGSSWPRPLTSPLAASSPAVAAEPPSSSLSLEASSASPEQELQFASGESPHFSGSSLEEDREVYRIVGNCGGDGGGDSDRKSSTGSGDDEEGNPRFKTEICRNFKEKGTCLYGSQCQFAHGSDEMRDSGKQNKYKTKLCQKYWIHGYCAYGARCNFLHNEEEGGRTTVGFPAKKRKASSGSGTGGGGVDSSGEQLDWIMSPRSGGGSGRSSAVGHGGGGGRLSASQASQATVMPPLSALHRPVHGSGRLAAYAHNNNYTWIDTWSKKIVN